MLCFGARIRTLPLLFWCGQYGEPEAQQAKHAAVELVAERVMYTADAGEGERIVDVATSPQGVAYVLLAGGEVVQVHVDGRTRRWGGRGGTLGRTMEPAGIAVDHAGIVYVFDDERDAITRFDQEGRPLSRALLPISMTLTSFSVGPQGRVFISGYSRDTVAAAVFEFDETLHSLVRLLGDGRPTQDSLATPFFQGGFLVVDEDSLTYMGMNPLSFTRYSRSTGAAARALASNELPDGELLAFERQDRGRIRISNSFPRLAGVVRLPSGMSYLYSAVFPREGRTLIGVRSADGELVASTKVDAFLSVKGMLPNGELVVVKMLAAQQVVAYRVAVGSRRSGEQ